MGHYIVLFLGVKFKTCLFVLLQLLGYAAVLEADLRCKFYICLYLILCQYLGLWFYVDCCFNFYFYGLIQDLKDLLQTEFLLVLEEHKVFLLYYTKIFKERGGEIFIMIITIIRKHFYDFGHLLYTHIYFSQIKPICPNFQLMIALFMNWDLKHILANMYSATELQHYQ